MIIRLTQTGKDTYFTYMNSAVNNFKQEAASELQKRYSNTKDYLSTIHDLFAFR